MKKILLILVCSFTAAITYAQAPPIQWQKCLGGTDYEEAYSIALTSDGGFIVAGYSASNMGKLPVFYGYADVWIVKLSSTGDIQWHKSLGGVLDEQAFAIRQTTDGGYIVAGWSESNDGDVSGNHGDHDYWIVKLSDSGVIQWQKCLGGKHRDIANSIQQTFDGGYIVAGNSFSNSGDVRGHHGDTTRSDYWIVKLSPSGSIEWQKSLGGENTDNAYSVQQTADSGYIVAGSTVSSTGDVSSLHSTCCYDAWVVKLSVSGAIQWQKCLGVQTTEVAYSIIQISTGGYIVAGGNETPSIPFSQPNVWLLQLSPSGDIERQKVLGSDGNAWARSIQQTSDGGFFVVGVVVGDGRHATGFHYSSKHSQVADIWAIKLSDSLKLQWQTCLGGQEDEYPAYNASIQTPDGGYIVCGYTRSNDGDVSGNHATYGSFDMWIMKFESTVGINPINKKVPISIIPNPTTGNISVEGVDHVNIKVYNTLGLLIKEAANTNNISLSECPVGMYFIQLFNEHGEMLDVGRVIKQ